jgi:hypothetical protein
MKKIFTVLLSVIVLTALVASPTFATVRKTGSQGDYFPITFNLADEDVPALIDVTSINVLFNPLAEAAKATPWKHHDIQGLDAPTLEFTSGEPYRLQMDLFFDRYEEGKSVREYTDKIEKLAVTLDGDPLKEETAMRSTECVVTWGLKQYQCILESFQTRFTLFLDDGTPVRAVMSTVWKEFSPADNGKNDGAHKRPGSASMSASVTLPAKRPE